MTSRVVSTLLNVAGPWTVEDSANTDAFRVLGQEQAIV